MWCSTWQWSAPPGNHRHFKNILIYKAKHVTLFRSIIVFCGTDNILRNIRPFSLNIKNMNSLEYCQSHITMSWIWIMLRKSWWQKIQQILHILDGGASGVQVGVTKQVIVLNWNLKLVLNCFKTCLNYNKITLNWWFSTKCCDNSLK